MFHPQPPSVICNLNPLFLFTSTLRVTTSSLWKKASMQRLLSLDVSSIPSALATRGVRTPLVTKLSRSCSCFPTANHFLQSARYSLFMSLVGSLSAGVHDASAGYLRLHGAKEIDIEKVAQDVVLREQEITTQQVIHNQRQVRGATGPSEDGKDIFSGRFDSNLLKNNCKSRILLAGIGQHFTNFCFSHTELSYILNFHHGCCT